MEAFFYVRIFMTSFTLLIQAAPGLPANSHALTFAGTLLEEGHTIVRLFFYGDGVYTAAVSQVVPQGEFAVGEAWQTLIENHNLDAVVCISAALRRGLVDGEEALRYQKIGNLLRPGFVLSGLGQLIEGSVSSERVVTFG